MVKQRKYTGSVAGSNPVLSKHFSVAVPKKEVRFDFVTPSVQLINVLLITKESVQQMRQLKQKSVCSTQKSLTTEVQNLVRDH